MNLRRIFPLLKQTAKEWSDDNAPSRAASLSYYTIFSIAPLLLIAVAIAGIVFGHQAVSGQLTAQLQGLLGEKSAEAIEGMMESASNLGSGIAASIIGVALLVLGACGAFVELQDTLNTMWGVDKSKTSGLFGFIKARLLSFAMIGVIAFLLLVSLVISAALAAVGHFAKDSLPAGEAVFHVLNFVVSFGVITFLFAIMFKILPDAKIPWGDVWLGAAVTALLFVIGKLLIGLYIGKSSASSSYGAAGSFAVLLIWIYYSSMIVFFGAEFTQVYAHMHGTLKTQRPGDANAKKGASPTKSAPQRISHA
jgi:membrane protein